MYEDLIAAVMQDMQDVDLPAARASALRGQPPPPPRPPMQPPPMQPPPGIPEGSWGPPVGGPPGPQMPPPATSPLPMPQKPPMGPPGPSGGALPRALGAQTPPMAPPAPIPDIPAGPDPLAARQEDLMRQYQQAMQPPDRSAMESAYHKRAEESPRMLTLALAAERAGKGGLAKHYYGQANDVDTPMKMAGGTMTPTGFIEDPGYAREFQLKKIEAQISQNDRIIQSNAVRKDKIEAEKRNEQLRRDLANQASGDRVALGNQASADRRYSADLLHQDRQATAAAAAGPGKATESERSSAGYLGRMEAVEKQINDLSTTGRPSFLTKAMGQFNLGRTFRPLLESSPQQQYRAVQEDWVRAKLRKESGASIPPDEMEREIETYFPQPGENDPKVIAIKAQARKQAQEQLRTSAGRVEATIAPSAPDASGASPVRVNTPAEAAKLAPGTQFVTPDGQVRVRQ